jgi:hypothetical protein
MTRTAGPCQRWNEYRDAKIRELRAAGLPVKDIAKQLAVHRMIVYAAIWKQKQKT